MTPRRDFERYAAIAALVLLVLGCYMVVRPFLTSFLWGSIIAVSTWGIYSRLLARLGQRRTLAAALTGLGLAMTLLVPIVALGLSLASQWPLVAEKVPLLLASVVREPPVWLSRLPIVGESASAYWSAAAANPGRLAEDLRPLFTPVKDFLIAFSAGLGGGLLESALALLIAVFLYARGAELGAAFLEFADRLGGDTGRRQVAVVATTVRAVFMGVIGTCAAQAVLAMIGYWVAGVPGAFLLGMATFFLAVVPGGPVLLWLPAAIWLKSNGAGGWALFMALWGFLIVSGADNVLRPLLIGKGVQAPMPLILLGVVGGVLAFGFLGLFIGPTLLAVGYNLLRQWMGRADTGARPAPT